MLFRSNKMVKTEPERSGKSGETTAAKEVVSFVEFQAGAIETEAVRIAEEKSTRETNVEEIAEAENMNAMTESRKPERMEIRESGESIITAKPKPKREIVFRLNGESLRLPIKEDGQPYYLMDLLEYSGIDLKNPKGTVKLRVNGMSGMFQQALKAGDVIDIQEE